MNQEKSPRRHRLLVLIGAGIAAFAYFWSANTAPSCRGGWKRTSCS